jgi:integrase
VKGKIKMHVEPIRDLNKINELKEFLRSKNYRDYLLFVFGINSGLRISDILKIKVLDVRNKTHVSLFEQKTGKSKKFPLNNSILEALSPYIINMKDEEYLFKSKQGINKPLTRTMAYIILNGAAKNVGIEEIGTHSLRKTFGFFHYQQFKDIAILQDILNHSSQRTTLKYLGILQNMIDKTYMDLKI